MQGERETSVQNWVSSVRSLRYKDYQLVSPVAPSFDGFNVSNYGSLEEVETVRAMADKMQDNGLIGWWRKAMGFSSE